MNWNLTEFFLNMTKHGAEWVLWLLVVLSLVSVAVMIDRLLYNLTRRVDADELAATLQGLLRNGKVEQARQEVAGKIAVECQVAKAGLAAFDQGAAPVSEALMAEKARQRLRMEARLVVLGTLGNNAPFIGLFGTVLGIIKASQDLAGKAGQSDAAGAVMSGVFEALVATAVGLLVAIPAVIAFNFFQRKVRSTMARCDIISHVILGNLKGDKPRTTLPTAGKPPVVAQPAVATQVS